MGRNTGSWIRTSVAGGESVQAFVPQPLPVTDPPLVLEGLLAERLAAAVAALAELKLAARLVPSLDWFLYAFVRKEAVLTSQIEGTQATLADLLQFESSGEDTPGPDVQEVCNYIDALTHARAVLGTEKGPPLSMRVLNDTHRILMRGVRGEHKLPGEIRRSQNWIGGSRPGNAAFVPPPPGHLPALLGDLEKYIHGDDPLPPLVRTGLVHVQLETIHPWLDGNGRMGRLLIALLLEHWGLLEQPLLYLSLHFRRHQAEYYRRLAAVRTDGDWEGWTDFFLDGVATVGREATATARALFARVSDDRQRLLDSAGVSVAGLRLLEQLPFHPIVTVALVMRLLDVTKPTAGRAIEGLVAAGILAETTGRRRDRAFAYRAYLDLLGRETAVRD